MLIHIYMEAILWRQEVQFFFYSNGRCLDTRTCIQTMNNKEQYKMILPSHITTVIKVLTEGRITEELKLTAQPPRQSKHLQASANL